MDIYKPLVHFTGSLKRDDIEIFCLHVPDVAYFATEFYLHSLLQT